jgi:N-acetylglucosamine-6-phosphate deacetylase
VIVRGRSTGDDRLIDVRIEGERISAVADARPGETPAVGGEAWHVAPGLFDIQVNGFAGHDYNAPPFDDASVQAIVDALLALGVTQHLPTVVTGSHGRMLASIRAVASARRDRRIARALPGLHLEGPYISPVDGPRGAHPMKHVRPPDWDEFQQFQEAAEGLIRLVTLSPEWDGAADFIAKLVAAGIVVALGHTDMTADQMRAAVDAGARLSTHLGNGSHASLDRHNNYFYQQLAEDRLWASLIVDGHHLPPPLTKIIARTKGAERLVLISDAVAAAGMPPGIHHFGDLRVEVSETKRVSLPGTPYLAGSALDLPSGIENVIRFAGVSLTDAIDMATLNPWELLSGPEHGRGLVPGAPADLVVFKWHDERKRLELSHTIAAGEVVFAAAD